MERVATYIKKWGKQITVGAIVSAVGFLYGINYKATKFVEKTNTTNAEVPVLREMFNQFKLDFSNQMTNINTTLSNFIADQKIQNQIQTQNMLNFQAEQIRILKDRNSETANNSNYNH